MADVLSGTLQEIAEQVEELNIKIAVMVAYDYAVHTWFVIGGDSTTGIIAT
jgi:hypothetical protein